MESNIVMFSYYSNKDLKRPNLNSIQIDDDINPDEIKINPNIDSAEIMENQADNIAMDLTTYREVNNETGQQGISLLGTGNKDIKPKWTYKDKICSVGMEKDDLIQTDKCLIPSYSESAIQNDKENPLFHKDIENIDSSKIDNKLINTNQTDKAETNPLQKDRKGTNGLKNFNDNEIDQIQSDSEEDFESDESSIKSYEKNISDNDHSGIESDCEDASSYDHSDADVRKSKRSGLKMCLRSTVRSSDGKIMYSVKNFNYSEYYNQLLYENYLNSSDEDGGDQKQYPLDFCDMSMEVKDDEIFRPNEIKTMEGNKDQPDNDLDYSPSHPSIKRKIPKKGEVRNYKCFRCSKSFATFFHLKRHRKTHASKRFICSVCKFRATTKERLLDHEDIHFQAKTFQCSQCDYGTNVKRYFRAHERNIHKIKNLKCNECDYETHRNDSFKLHVLSHAETRKFKCSTCEYTTNRKDYLKIHEMNHSDVKQFKCLKCDYATNCKRNLKLHDNVHQDAKILKCSLCDYETNRRQSLKLHELNHLDVKKFRCDKCNYATNGKLNLRQHALTHLETKKFKCPECKYATNFKSNFKNHEKIHLNVKLLKCPDCNYETNIKQSLKTHMFYHSETKRFKCSLCDFCTNYKTSLNHHELTHVNSFVENY